MERNKWMHRRYSATGAGLRGWLVAACLLLAGGLSSPARAGTTVSLYKSYAGNINFVTVGNTLRANDNNTDACSLLSGLTGNNVDAGSSSATVVASGSGGIPTGSTIVAAYLFYAGSGTTVDNTVTLNGTSVTADQTWTDTTLVPFFGGEKDVTSLIPANPDSTYTFSGLSVSNSNTWCSNQTVLAGWALVIIYSNSSEANRVINIYDGFQLFQNNSITLTPANFKVPNPPVAGSKFAVVTWEGDPTLSGNETLEFNGNVLTDTCNGTNNQYNSTINYQGTVSIDTCTGNAAVDDSYYGVDVDTFPVDSALTAGETSATTFYQSGPDAVLLTAQIASISNVPVSDLSITKSHTGNLAYGNNATWTLTATNNGPATSAGTTSVTDTLPTGVTYVSASGSGWSCSATGQTVTCNSTGTIASGANYPSISLTAFIGASAASPLANTASVSSSGGNFDNVSSNDSSTDTATLLAPDLSTSTKNVINTGGGDAVVGSTLQYTITIKESAGVQASSVSVSDAIPANLSGFTPASVTVTGSSTSVTNSSTATGGANGDGLLSLSNITVPANGSVTVVFTAQVKSGTANCTTISNTGTVSDPYGPGATPSSNDVVVAQSSCTASGNKILYVYDNQTLTRTPQTAAGAGVTVGEASSLDWTQSPAFQKTFTLSAGTVTVQLLTARSGSGGGNATRNYTVSILKNGAVIGTSASSGNFTSNVLTLRTSNVTVPATTFAPGDTLGLRVNNTSTGGGSRTLLVEQLSSPDISTVSFSTPTVINVDSVTAYSAAYPSTSQPTNGVFLPGQTVYVCAVVSDPFGSADTDPATGGTAPQITLTDPTGTVQVGGAAMTNEAATDCGGTASTTTEAFEYAYTTSFSLPTGFWTASVTASEGTEGTVTHTANGSFDLDVPSLLIMKTVLISSDPVEGSTRAKAIPGATAQYTITVQNNGRGPVDSGTLVISDPVPTNTVMSLPATPPFTFTDGSTPSGMSATSGSDANIVYSNNGGSTYTYVPACARPCTDSAITNFKITLNGSMNGKTGATAPSFTLSFQVVIQ